MSIKIVFKCFKDPKCIKHILKYLTMPNSIFVHSLCSVHDCLLISRILIYAFFSLGPSLTRQLKLENFLCSRAKKICDLIFILFCSIVIITMRYTELFTYSLIYNLKQTVEMIISFAYCCIPKAYDCVQHLVSVPCSVYRPAQLSSYLEKSSSIILVLSFQKRSYY